MQVGNFSKIDNYADWNKNGAGGIFSEINKLDHPSFENKKNCQ